MEFHIGTSGLNYHQLYLFWVVARTGGASAAARKLGLAQPTITAQVNRLQETLNRTLLERRGRRLQLTSDGRLLLSYCDQIFELGRELEHALSERGPTPREMVVGVADPVPKLVASQVIQPLLESDTTHNIHIREWALEELIKNLRDGQIDMVISEEPAGGAIRGGTSVLVGRSKLGLFAPRHMADMLRPGFPNSINNCRALLPTVGTPIRAMIDGWLLKHGVNLRVLASIDDSALTKACATQAGAVFFAYASIKSELGRQHQADLIGITDIAAEVYVISMLRSPWRKTIQQVIRKSRAFFKEADPQPAVNARRAALNHDPDPSTDPSHDPAVGN